jgi:hypothetical protein
MYIHTFGHLYQKEIHFSVKINLHNLN